MGFKTYLEGPFRYWYDPYTKCWVLYKSDCLGNQLEEASHFYTKREVRAEIKSRMEEDRLAFDNG